MTPEQFNDLKEQLSKQTTSATETLSRLIYDLSTDMKVYHAKTDTKIDSITHRQDLANGKVGKLETRVHELELEEGKRGQNWKIVVWSGMVIFSGIIGYFINNV